MSFSESPAQRKRQEAKNALFGLPPVFGPWPEDVPGFPKSEGQQKRDDYKKAFFETKTLKKSSVSETADAVIQTEQPGVKERPISGGKSKNESVGEDGSIQFIDCDGAQTGYIAWEKGKVLTAGHQIIQGGCTPTSSYP